MLSGFQREEQAVLYGVTGGIPEYLSHIQGNLSVHENIAQLFFEESGRLFEEPLNLMKQEKYRDWKTRQLWGYRESPRMLKMGKA